MIQLRLNDSKQKAEIRKSQRARQFDKGISLSRTFSSCFTGISLFYSTRFPSEVACVDAHPDNFPAVSQHGHGLLIGICCRTHSENSLTDPSSWTSSPFLPSPPSPDKHPPSPPTPDTSTLSDIHYSSSTPLPSTTSISVPPNHITMPSLRRLASWSMHPRQGRWSRRSRGSRILRGVEHSGRMGSSSLRVVRMGWSRFSMLGVERC